MDLRELGRRLKKLRLEHHPDKSHVEFEALSGVSRGSIENIEDGEGKFGPGIVTIEKWLNVCGTTLREFFGAPSSADFKLPFKWQPEDTPFFQMLSDILEAGDDELSHGIYVNLRELSRTAREMLLNRQAGESRASPRPTNGREKQHGRGSRPRRPKARRIPKRKNDSGQEQTGT